MNAEIIGITASVFTSSALLPQAIKIAKEKEAGDVSTGMLLVLLSGLALWLWYGIVKEDMVLIVANAVSFVITCSTLLLCLRYKGYLIKKSGKNFSG